MRYADPPEDGGAGMAGREVDTTTSRPTPLALVSDAVAGGDLRGVAETVARALGCPVVIAIPALGLTAILPEGSIDDATAAAISAYAERTVAAGDGAGSPPGAVSEAVPVRIAEQITGIVAAVTPPVTANSADEFVSKDRSGTNGSSPAVQERRAWLEAAATAASVTALILEAHARPTHVTEGAEVLAELSAGVPEDLATLLSRARRIGVELRGGAIALAARRPAPAGDHDGEVPPVADQFALLSPLPSELPTLAVAPAPGRLQALVPLSPAAGAADAERIADALRSDGWTVVLSAPRRDPGQLHQALLEAELLAELHSRGALPAGQEDTYRLLIGVLLRDREELETLREQTISPLAEYDARHDTELLATLRAFLLHDGSTTETADAMCLHRHTVGYRLSRVHEVSGLSPYESTGRERLSLGLKAEQIIESARLRTQTQLNQ
jgi:hypothetical protein